MILCPAISRKTSGLNGLAYSREKQKACQPPAEKQFNLSHLRACNKVTVPAGVHPRLLPIQLQVQKDLQQNNRTLPKWARSSFGAGCISGAVSIHSTKQGSSHLKTDWITSQRIVNQVILLVFSEFMPSHAVDLKDGQHLIWNRCAAFKQKQVNWLKRNLKQMRKIFPFRTDRGIPQSLKRTWDRQKIKVELWHKNLHYRNYISVSVGKSAMTFLQALQIQALFLQLLETTQFGITYDSSCILSALCFT